MQKYIVGALGWASLITVLGLASLYAVELFVNRLGSAEEQLLKQVRSAQIGSTKDYWLTQRGRFDGKFSPVVLVFGFTDDFAVCRDLETLYRQKYPKTDVRCEPAN